MDEEALQRELKNIVQTQFAEVMKPVLGFVSAETAQLAKRIAEQTTKLMATQLLAETSSGEVHSHGPLLPTKGNYVVTYVDPTGKKWAAVYVTREFFDAAYDSGPAVVEMLDDKIESITEKASND